MQSWLAKKAISYAMERNRQGDLRVTLALDAPDVQFTFPGQNSWSGVYHGKAEVHEWLRRMVRIGLETYPEDVIASGWPWKTTACIRGVDHCDAPDGTRVYENRFVIWATLSWGRVKAYEVYEDTHKANEFDTWLAEHEASLPAAA